ncbi:MAG: hypothetical protein COW00_03365 [Bdellovibrio sp. CG12_big_fil_rev_8_21_14_0_65_39_13]|nr:MAG: hypothetical protein COW78_15105 [Bdellovibrio sp. CG22_combo_CG10-13_8_21_14_all_39_27]PIQ61617.1 MAG: hypothetical protein COW00_03365 [Bdellovibrio sp. CG12_big_fil_rev_8_21_14_0_65_39_13]PIR35680.1 MAG: hypothetical protein COV37_07160 [Bdellovibrio sp. CG11_big_fil_rev_8_21_14_0_20_39_38]
MRKFLYLILLILASQSAFSYDGEDYDESSSEYSEADAIPTQMPIDELKYEEVPAPELAPTPIPMDESPAYEPTENYDDY